jgi:PAS domain S-box-containing protein
MVQPPQDTPQTEMNTPLQPAFPSEAGAVAYSCVAGSCVPFYVNPAVERLTGYRCEEFSACPQLWLKLILEDDRQRVIEGLASLMREGTLELEYRIVHADGSLKVIRSTAEVVRSARGSPERIDGVITDITGSRRPEDRTAALPQYSTSKGLRSVTASTGEALHGARSMDHTEAYQRVARMRRAPDARYQTVPTDGAATCGYAGERHMTGS